MEDGDEAGCLVETGDFFFYGGTDIQGRSQQKKVKRDGENKNFPIDTRSREEQINSLAYDDM